MSGAAFAQSYERRIQPTGKYKQKATVNSHFRFRLNGDGVSVSDQFFRATGKRSVNGKFDRQVGSNLLFSWSVMAGAAAAATSKASETADASDLD